MLPTGTLVWAKQKGRTPWPAMVSPNTSGETQKMMKKTPWHHVIFLEFHNQHAWISHKGITLFTGPTDYKTAGRAIKAAETASRLQSIPIEDRSHALPRQVEEQSSDNNHNMKLKRARVNDTWITATQHNTKKKRSNDGGGSTQQETRKKRNNDNEDDRTYQERRKKINNDSAQKNRKEKRNNDSTQQNRREKKKNDSAQQNRREKKNNDSAQQNRREKKNNDRAQQDRTEKRSNDRAQQQQERREKRNDDSRDNSDTVVMAAGEQYPRKEPIKMTFTIEIPPESANQMMESGAKLLENATKLVGAMR